jgi:hypothetical protein
VTEAVSSLIVGERVISRCEDGLLVTEYALFDPSEVMVSATTGQGVREQGYFTTAGSARERLHTEGITAKLARDAFGALRPRHMRALARSSAVLQAIELLGPYEAFEGGTFRASSGTYQGAWLDLAALARACPLRNAASLFQAIHLAQVVEEVSDDVPVRLLTANATGSLRAGERTWTKVELESARRLPAVLRAMRVPSRINEDLTDEVEVREELVRGLRARASGSKFAQPRIRLLATVVGSTGKTPLPSDPGEGDKAADTERASPLVSPRELRLREAGHAGDPAALFEELRGHTQLLRGEDHLRAVAQFLSAMAERSPSQPDLGVLASRAWLAAGEPGHARHFSAQVVENPVAPDAMRLLALEIIESTEAHLSSPPPYSGPTIVPTPILNAVPHEFSPAGASLPPKAPENPQVTLALHRPAPSFPPAGLESVREKPQAPALSNGPPVVVTSPVVIVQTPPRTVDPVREPTVIVSDPHPVTARPAAPPSRPPPTVRAERIESPPDMASAVVQLSRPPPSYTRAEIVESLSLPSGLTEDMLDTKTKPSSPGQARIAMTRLSRALGRDYRLWYGTALKVDAMAIETMQRHLRRRFDDASAADMRSAKKLEAELTRHGALLSEILARALGGAWVDLSGDLPGRWAMVIHPNVRVWPIGRVYRFFKHGHREADLVAFFLDLESGARRSP